MRIHRRGTAFAVAALVAAAAAGPIVTAQPAAALDLPLNVGGFQDGVYVPLDDLLIAESGGAAVVANGNLSLTWAGSTLEPQFNEDDELVELDSDLGLRGALTLDLSASAAGGFDELLEVLELPLGSFQAGPAEVTPYLGINVRISGAAEAGAQLSVVAPFDVSAALAKRDGGHHAGPSEPPSFRPEIGLPDAASALALEVSVELEITMTFMMSIGPIAVGGPALNASLGASLAVDLDADAWWTISGLAGLDYGWSWPEADGSPQPPDPWRELFPHAEVVIDAADDEGPLSDVSTRWSRSFDVHNGDTAGAIVANGDELAVFERYSSWWSAALDGVGNPTWQHQQANLLGYVDAATRTRGGGLVTAGRSSPGVRAERFNGGGRTQWAKQIDLADVSSSNWSAVVPVAGGVLLAGNVAYPDQTQRAALVAVRDDGTVQATVIDPGPQYATVEVAAASAAPGGGAIVVGSVVHPNSAHENSEALVMHVDRNGAVESAIAFGEDASGHGEEATGVAVQSDGSYAISGQTSGFLDDHYSWVAEFSAADEPRWSSTYLDRPAGDLPTVYGGATGIAPVDGGYIVSGFTGMSGSDGWLMRVDHTGMPVWSKTLVGTGTDTLTDVVAMPTGVAAFGETNTTDPVGGSFSDIWLVRVNRDGMLHFAPDSGFDALNGSVQWHQNTTHDVKHLTPTTTNPVVTVTDAPSGTVVAAAVNNALT